MIIKSSADFAGTGTPVALSTILGVKKCKWFQVVGLTVLGEPGRVGESDISIDVVSPYAAGKGAPMMGGGSIP